MNTTPAHKIVFQGTEYWRDDNLISPISHYDKDGNFCAPLGSVSYAIIQGNEILRFGEVIGSTDEIINIQN